MPGGGNLPQHSGRSNRPAQPRPGQALIRPRRRGRTARYGTVALTAAFCLIAGMAAMRAAVGGPAGDATALAVPNCPSAPRAAADAADLGSAATATPLGVNATGRAQLARATSQFGHLPVIRVYYAGVPSATEWTTGATGINKSAVVLSFNPTPAQVLSGADNAGLAHFFDSAPRTHAIYYSFYPEPEAHIKSGEFSFSQYKAAWSRVVSIADAAHNPQLHATLILQGQDGRPGDQYNFRNYLPASGVISVIGWDAYPDGTVADQDPQPVPPAQFMGPDVAASRSVGLPFGFAEFALGTSADRPHWLSEVASYLQSSGALFGTLFDASGFPWMVLNDGASIQTWRTLVARSETGAPVSVLPSAPVPPAPTPVPSTPSPHPSPSPTRPASPAAPPAGSRPALTGLSITPGTLVSGHGRHVRIRFRLPRAAQVSVCVLNRQGVVVRWLRRPDLAAGWATVRYYGYGPDGLLPAGRYRILVKASAGTGTTTIRQRLTIIRPGNWAV
jgi:hypothetical protein